VFKGRAAEAPALPFFSPLLNMNVLELVSTMVRGSRLVRFAAERPTMRA
jgi:hypothetical protein